MSKLKIYSARICPFAERAMIELEEKGVDYEVIEVDLQNKSAEFLAVSPHGKVPVIEHHGNVVYESNVILEYLEEAFPTPRMMSDDLYLRAQARIWMAYAGNTYAPLHYKLLKSEDATLYPEQQAALLASLQFIEREGFAKFSQTGPYFFGEEISLVDVSLFPFFERFPLLAHYRDFNLPVDCERLRAWIKAMYARSAVQKLLNPPQFYVEAYAKRYTHLPKPPPAVQFTDPLWQI